MLPSREITEVDIGNMSCANIKPSQPTQQLKILRRPRPDNKTNSTLIIDNPQLGANKRLHSIKQEQQSNNSHLKDDNEWPTLSNAITLKNTGSQKMNNLVSRNGVRMKNLDRCLPSQQIDAVKVSQSKHDPHLPIRAASNPYQLDSVTTRLKSYQERAEDYAKARMRIFGFASSDEAINQPTESRVNNS